jgi:hypothetical protein
MVGTKVELFEHLRILLNSLSPWTTITALIEYLVSQVVVSIQNETKFSPYNENQLNKSRSKSNSRNVVYIKYS